MKEQEKVHWVIRLATAPDYKAGQIIITTDNLETSLFKLTTGVTICYNSVSDVRYIQPVVEAPCAMCINPVNWRIDATSATLHDTITVAVSPEHHVLVLKGRGGYHFLPSHFLTGSS